MRAALLCGEQHARVTTGDTPMLTSYGRSGRLKRLQPKFRKGRHCRVEQGCDPSDPRRNLFEHNYSPACVASATAKPVALPPGRCLPTKSWRGARDHRARIFDDAAGTGPAASLSHRVGLNRKARAALFTIAGGAWSPAVAATGRTVGGGRGLSEGRTGKQRDQRESSDKCLHDTSPGLDHRHRFVHQR